jgi:nucleoside-diphosphate-sugar epimerase
MDLLFGTHKFNCVIHLAAAHKDFGIPEEEYFSVNEGGMKVLCALCTKYNVQKFVFFSSVAVYGTQENSTDENTLPSPDNHYGASKWSAEKVLHQWQHENAERLAIILRPALVFGEGNTANMYRLIDQISKKRYFNVGRGNNVKSIAYVKNVVNATLYLLNAKENGLPTVWLGVWKENAKALAFYTSFGFRIFGETDFILGNDLQKDWLMCKVI